MCVGDCIPRTFVGFRGQASGVGFGGRRTLCSTELAPWPSAFFALSFVSFLLVVRTSRMFWVVKGRDKAEIILRETGRVEGLCQAWWSPGSRKQFQWQVSVALCSSALLPPLPVYL